jgi:beta-carotene 3-hydroxylase
MDLVLNLFIVLAMAVLMEFVAWFTHKYVMHGFLWVLHADHHRPVDRGWQKNDLFALFFSAISCPLIIVGLLQRWTPMLSFGLGMALYGAGYLLFHDVMFHRRIPGLRIRAKGRYLARIVHAHKVHHQSGGWHNATAFGFLYAGKEYDVR